MPPVLVTGAAGFVGFHLATRLLDDGREVVGVDSLNDYYEPALKHARLEQLVNRRGFRLVKLDLAYRAGTADLFEVVQRAVVALLAAQAGVRYSLEAPHEFVASILKALVNVLEACRRLAVGHLVFASSS
jgi:UDP-glucuronate 4-epimerase